MEISGKPMEFPTEETKSEKWRLKCYAWSEEAEANYKADNKTVATLMALEITGGRCPKCSIEWHRVEFNNSLGSGVHYKPACSCYYKCPRCHRSLHLEDAGGLLADNDYFCTNCGFPLNGLAEEEWIKRCKNEFSKKWLKRYIESYRKQ